MGVLRADWDACPDRSLATSDGLVVVALTVLIFVLIVGVFLLAWLLFEVLEVLLILLLVLWLDLDLVIVLVLLLVLEAAHLFKVALIEGLLVGGLAKERLLIGNVLSI